MAKGIDFLESMLKAATEAAKKGNPGDAAFIDNMVDMGKKGAEFIKPLLKSNKPIQTVEKSASKAWGESGMLGVKNAMRKDGMDFPDAVKSAFTKQDGKSLAYGQIASSYIGASTAYRAVSGGGLYKDSGGNTNMVGIPLI